MNKTNLNETKNRFRMDKSCILCATLFTFSNFLFLIYFYQEQQYNAQGGFSYESMLLLEPHYILQTWKHRFSYANLTSWASLFNAFAWFSMVIPITQLAYILSNGGKRKPIMHAYLVLLVFTGSFTEFLSRLIMSGMEDSTRHLIIHFSLDDWETAYDGEKDGMGWRVLELIHNIVRGTFSFFSRLVRCILSFLSHSNFELTLFE